MIFRTVTGQQHAGWQKRNQSCVDVPSKNVDTKRISLRKPLVNRCEIESVSRFERKTLTKNRLQQQNRRSGFGKSNLCRDSKLKHRHETAFDRKHRHKTGFKPCTKPPEVENTRTRSNQACETTRSAGWSVDLCVPRCAQSAPASSSVIFPHQVKVFERNRPS